MKDKQTKNLEQQLLEAVKNNHTEKVKTLLSQGANVNLSDASEVPLVMWAALKCSLDLFQHLIYEGADTNQKGIIQLTETSHYGNLTGIAAAEGKFDLLQYLIETLEIDVDDPEIKHGTTPQWTALQWAISKGETAIVQYLLAQGANPNPLYSHTTALHICVQKQAINSFKYLLKAGAKTNLPGYRPLLSEACRYPNHRFLEILVEQDVALNAEKQAPIFFAVAYGDLDRVKWLIEKGANPVVQDAHGHSPLSLAKKLGLKKIEKYLKKLVR